MSKPLSSLNKYCLNCDVEKMSLTGVYRISHMSMPGKFYVGSTCMRRAGSVKNQGFLLRLRLHISELSRKKHPNLRLQRAVDEFGIDGIRFEILEILDPIRERLNEREQFWMNKLDSVNNGFNMFPNAGTSLGHTGVMNCNGDAVSQYDLSGNLIQQYQSMHEVTRVTGLHFKGISRCCLGDYGRCTYGGFVWRFAGDPFDKYSLPSIDVSVKGIDQYSVDGVFIKRWETQSDAAKTLKTSMGNISMCAHGQRRIAGGFIWRFPTKG